MVNKENTFNIDEKMVFRLGNQKSPKEINLLHLEWAVITQLDGKKTVGEIGDLLNLSKTELFKIFKKLNQVNLLELISIADKKNYIDEEIFSKIEFELTRFLGPVSSILMEDVFYLMGKNRRAFTQPELSVFIDLISNHILDETKKGKFQQTLLNKLNTALLIK